MSAHSNPFPGNHQSLFWRSRLPIPTLAAHPQPLASQRTALRTITPPSFLTLPHPAAPQAAKGDEKASRVLVVGDRIGRVLGDDLGRGAAGTGGARGGAAGDGRARERGLMFCISACWDVGGEGGG